MKKAYFLIFIFAIFNSSLHSQVGIGTEFPLATLDVDGTLKVRNIPIRTSVSNEQAILMVDKSNPGDFIFAQITKEDLAASLGTSSFSGTAYGAKKTGGWSLLNLGIAGTNWHKINLTGASDTYVGDAANFVDGVFTAPSSGIYSVTYEFQLQGGIDLSVLGNKQLGLIRNGTEIVSQKMFDAVRVFLAGIINLASVPLTSTTLSSLVELEEEDTLTFAVETGGVNLNLLTSNKVSLAIHKVSN